MSKYYFDPSSLNSLAQALLGGGREQGMIDGHKANLLGAQSRKTDYEAQLLRDRIEGQRNIKRDVFRANGLTDDHYRQYDDYVTNKIVPSKEQVPTTFFGQELTDANDQSMMINPLVTAPKPEVMEKPEIWQPLAQALMAATGNTAYGGNGLDFAKGYNQFREADNDQAALNNIGKALSDGNIDLANAQNTYRRSGATYSPYAMGGGGAVVNKTTGQVDASNPVAQEGIKLITAKAQTEQARSGLIGAQEQKTWHDIQVAAQKIDRDSKGKPTGLTGTDLKAYFEVPSLDAKGNPITDIMTGRAAMQIDNAKVQEFAAWQYENGIENTQQALQAFAAYKKLNPVGQALSGRERLVNDYVSGRPTDVDHVIANVTQPNKVNNNARNSGGDIQVVDALDQFERANGFSAISKDEEQTVRNLYLIHEQGSISRDQLKSTLYRVLGDGYARNVLGR